MKKISLKYILLIFITLNINLNLVDIEFNPDINFYIDSSPNIIYITKDK